MAGNDSQNGDNPDLDAFRHDVVEMLARNVADGTACPAFGAILIPDLHDRARVWQQAMSDQGMAGLHWPGAFGGQGLTRAHSTIWFEECARAQVAPYLNLQGIILAGEAILRSGTDAQKAEHLPQTLTGETLWCQLFSEPGSGSDLASLSTTATRDGDRFIVNGQKVWSSNAQFAEKAILMARTDPDASPHRGISFFLLDMTLPGIEVRPIKQMTGDSEFCEVFLTDVEIPVEALLGDAGTGWNVAMNVLIDERGSFGEAGVISLERELDELVRGRLPAGGAPGRGVETGAVQTGSVESAKLAELLGRGNALKALLKRLGSTPTAAPAAKLMRTELSLEINALEASIRGANAMLDDDETRSFLYSPGMRVAGGTSEIQRNIIGERVLGLPKEPR